MKSENGWVDFGDRGEQTNVRGRPGLPRCGAGTGWMGGQVKQGGRSDISLGQGNPAQRAQHPNKPRATPQASSMLAASTHNSPFQPRPPSVFHSLIPPELRHFQGRHVSTRLPWLALRTGFPPRCMLLYGVAAAAVLSLATLATPPEPKGLRSPVRGYQVLSTLWLCTVHNNAVNDEQLSMSIRPNIGIY